MNDINKTLVEEGLTKDLCKPWALKMKNASIDELLQMYVDGIDFCLDNNFPSNDFLKQNAGDKLKSFGIVVDDIIEISNPIWMALLGNSRCESEINSFTVSELFLKHKSTANLIIKDNAIVTIDCFDDSFLVVETNQNCKVMINLYGKSKIKTIENGGKITVVNKLKNTYK